MQELFWTPELAQAPEAKGRPCSPPKVESISTSSTTGGGETPLHPDEPPSLQQGTSQHAKDQLVMREMSYFCRAQQSKMWTPKMVAKGAGGNRESSGETLWMTEPQKIPQAIQAEPELAKPSNKTRRLQHGASRPTHRQCLGTVLGRGPAVLGLSWAQGPLSCPPLKEGSQAGCIPRGKRLCPARHSCPAEKRQQVVALSLCHSKKTEGGSLGWGCRGTSHPVSQEHPSWRQSR